MAVTMKNAVFWDVKFLEEPHGITSQKMALFTVQVTSPVARMSYLQP
jgi:hypothetical protein